MGLNLCRQFRIETTEFHQRFLLSVSYRDPLAIVAFPRNFALRDNFVASKTEISKPTENSGKQIGESTQLVVLHKIVCEQLAVRDFLLIDMIIFQARTTCIDTMAL